MSDKLQRTADEHPTTKSPRTCPVCRDTPSTQNQCCCGFIGPHGDARYVATLERDYHALRDIVAKLAKGACKEALR